MIRKRTTRRTNVSKKSAHRVAVAAKQRPAPAPQFASERKHNRAPVAKPTWPATDNQRKQSRPLICERPMRAIALHMLLSNEPGKDGLRSLTSAQRGELRNLVGAPKHHLDARACA